MSADDLDLAAVEARATAATDGPWTWYGSGLRGQQQADGTLAFVIAHTDEDVDVSDNDAEFIAHARTDIPHLVAEVRRLRAELEGANVW